MTTPVESEERQVRVDPSAYCLTRVARESMPEADVVTIPEDGEEPSRYRLVFPLSPGGGVKGYVEERTRGRLLRLFNGMCLGAVLARNNVAAEIAKEASKLSAEETCEQYRPVGYGWAKVITRCCDCGRDYERTFDTCKFVRGQATFGCACGALATAYFTPKGSIEVEWESPKRPECPVPAHLLDTFQRLVDRMADTTDQLDVVQGFLKLELGEIYYQDKLPSFLEWRSASHHWDQDNHQG